METQSLVYLPGSASTSRKLPVRIPTAELTRGITRWTTAGAVAALVTIAAIWAATNPAVTQYLNAAIWGAGFIFLALAVDVGIKRIYPFVTTGIALPLLALLGSHVTEEFSVLAGVVVAAWLAHWIGRRP